MYNLRNRIVYPLTTPHNGWLCLETIANNIDSPFLKSKLACVAKDISKGGKPIVIINDLIDLANRPIELCRNFTIYDGDLNSIMTCRPHDNGTIYIKLFNYSVTCRVSNMKKYMLQYTVDSQNLNSLYNVKYPLMLHLAH